MESPFSGMDPYLECHSRGVHQRLVTYACDQLQARLPCGLRADLEERVFVEGSDARKGCARQMVREPGGERPRRSDSLTTRAVRLVPREDSPVCWTRTRWTMPSPGRGGREARRSGDRPRVPSGQPRSGVLHSFCVVIEHALGLHDDTRSRLSAWESGARRWNPTETRMRRDKDEILELIRRLPEDVTTADVMDELYFKEQVDKGLRDVAEGRVITHEELKARVSRWRMSAGR